MGSIPHNVVPNKGNRNRLPFPVTGVGIRQHRGMEKKTVRQLIADAVNGAIKANHTTHKKLVEAGAAANGPLGRLRHAQDDIGVDTLERLAIELGIEPWQLIHPDLDPAAIPGHAKLSDDAVELALELDKILNKDLKRVVHAAAMQVVRLNPEAFAAQGSTAAAAPAAPAPVPKKKRTRHP